MQGEFSLFSGVVLAFTIGATIAWAMTRKYYIALFSTNTLAAKQQLSDQEKFYTAQQEMMKLNFEAMAENILQKKQDKLEQFSGKSLQDILQPFKEKLAELQGKVEQTYHQESRERFALKSELLKMIEAGQKMSVETTNLTNALKGDVKMQGGWGEFVLERILEVAGLKEGEEYIKQGINLGLKAEDGSAQKPDIIIALPEGKHLIIDAKVSLVSYERFCNSNDEEQKIIYQKQFVASLYQHVDGLAEKKYHLNQQLLSPDFTMLFVPIEGAFAMGMNVEPELFAYAWNKSIVIVSPVNLLTTLKTVGSLWRQERQSKHVLTIASEAGKLYDKMVGFVEDLLKIGEQLDRAQNVYQSALGKLSQGKGNVISKMQLLREMGIKHSKQLPSEVINETKGDSSGFVGN